MNLLEQTQRLVYHGTSDLQWNKKENNTLFLTIDRDEAASYADERVVADYGILDLDATDTPPSKAIIVIFNLHDLIERKLNFAPDWGWVDQHNFVELPTYEQSISAVGSFCIENFPNELKSLGKIVDAF